MWIDVTYENLYGHVLPPVLRYAIRRLKLQDPRVVKRFIDLYRTWIEFYELSSRAFALQRYAKYPLSPEHAVEYEWLDHMKIEGLRYADRHCRKLSMGEVPWSPQLQVLRHKLGYWQLVTKKLVGCKISTQLIERTREKGLVERVLLREITYTDAWEAERIAYKTYMAFKQTHSREARDTFLDELAHAIATEGKMKHASVVKSLKTREYIRHTYRRIRWAFDNQQQGAITFVEIDDAEGNPVEKATKDEVEQACMEENEQ